MSEGILKEQFDSLEQQHDASRLGLWLFLATEFLFFGGLFMGFAVYHLVYPLGFAAAGKLTNLWCGSINAALLLTSGLTMALGVNAAQRSRAPAASRWVALTMLLGAAFLAVKGVEYADDIHKHLVPGAHFALANQPPAQIYFWLYWTMTGLHAVHLLIGLGLLAAVWLKVRRGRWIGAEGAATELTGLYWGFVDVIWIFLYPLLYLIDRHT
ncbi:MAG TPA: cytochrome c oxidase subunit 3 [Verrucomicrobiae bacterium]|jgi:cytochrome c oxidase subunit 3|nr:cytochrome c oxidase subunit 3 [Verrucomicrobiae bacterium]